MTVDLRRCYEELDKQLRQRERERGCGRASLGVCKASWLFSYYETGGYWTEIIHALTKCQKKGHHPGLEVGQVGGRTVPVRASRERERKD